MNKEEALKEFKEILSIIKNIANGIELSNKQPSITLVKPPITNKITIIALSI